MKTEPAKFLSNTKQGYVRIVLLLIPLLFLGLNLYYLFKCGPRSLLNYDPEYIYLYSGISLGRLHLNVGHIDNPGTPLQILYALITRITHLIAGEGDYYTDVLQRSDFYLQWISISIAVLVSTGLYAFSYLFCKLVTNILPVVLLQLSPFLNLTTFMVFGRIVPEMLMIFPVLLLFYFILQFLQSEELVLSKTERWKFALVAALGLSIKLDYLPLILIPVFFLGSFRNIIYYFIRLTGFFFIFAFPTLYNLRFFFRWVSGLAIHSGRYGNGAKKVIDWAQTGDRLGQLFANYPAFVIISGIFLIGLVIVLTRSTPNRKLRSVLLGITVCITFHILLLAKQFSLHYIIPSVFLFPMMIYLIIQILIPDHLIKKVLYALTILLFLFMTIQPFQNMMKWKIPAQKNKREIVNAVRKHTENAPLLIISYPYNATFAESGLLFGWFFCGKMRESATDILVQTYPDRYIYDLRNDAFFLWGELVDTDTIVAEKDEFYVFADHLVKESQAHVLEAFRTQMSEECIYQNPDNGDMLYFYRKGDLKPQGK